MDMLKIAVVGAGGVGGYVAAKLAFAEVPVTLFARGKHLEAIQKEGLRVIEPDGEFRAFPDTALPKVGEVFDVVFLTVKSYDFKSACERVAPFVSSDTLVIPLSNGVGHKETIQKYLPDVQVCDGCVYIVSHLKSPGMIVKKTPLFYMIFGDEMISPKMEVLAELLNASGLKTKLSQYARYDCWKKYLFIATFATLTSYYKMGMKEVYIEHRDEVEQLLSEIKSVAHAVDIPISVEDIAKVYKQAGSLPPNVKTSMLLDFEAGKRTELESLSGYVVHEAKRLGLEVPLMQKCYESLKERDV